MGSDIRDVHRPNRIRCINVDVLLQTINRDYSRLNAILTWATFIADLNPQSLTLHVLCDRVRNGRFPRVEHVAMYLAISINAATLEPRLLDKDRQAAPTLG